MCSNEMIDKFLMIDFDDRYFMIDFLLCNLYEAILLETKNKSK